MEDGFLSTLSFPRLDADGAVGRISESGALTAVDAAIMNRIWAGPQRKKERPSDMACRSARRPGVQDCGVAI